MRSTQLWHCLIVFWFAIFSPANVSAKLLQIIHTNDLHANFDSSDTPGRGGYAAVKGLIDSLRDAAALKGIETLTVDAGDFADGSIYRYAEKGGAPLRLMDAMGYDAVTIGNHDWLIGTSQLDGIFGMVRPHTRYLGANIAIPPSSKYLASHIESHTVLTRAGARIGIVGLTTSDLIYSWRMNEGGIDSPKKVGADLISKLKRETDYVFLLSHLGHRKDKNFVKKVRGIDLVIGSHSHDFLYDPVYREDPDSRTVPIVQAGAHGEVVGDLLVDLVPGQPLKIIRYRLIPVQSRGPRDPHVDDLVKKARLSLEEQYGANWLSEPVAFSQVPMLRPDHGPTVWGTFYADTLREVAKADIGLDISGYYGTNQPPGPITREALYNFFPRTFDLKTPFGWTIWKVRAPGWLIKLTITTALKFGGFCNTSNISYDLKVKNGKVKFKNFKVGGKPFSDTKIYSLGVSEGIGRGSDEISSYLRAFFKPKDTGLAVWSAVEQRLADMNKATFPPPYFEIPKVMIDEDLQD